MSDRSTFAAVLTLVAVVLAACSAPTAEESVSTSTLASLGTLAPEPTTTTTTTTTLPPTTTTTLPAIVVADTVNGLPADEDATSRRAVVIKIDNHPDARPQSGLMEADLVYEMLVEGGLTRFAAVFHQSDLEWIGPVRSGRPTDVGVVRALDAPFQVSGAQWWVQDIFEREGLRMAWDRGIATWREDTRTAPHNLFASSLLLRDLADTRGWPDENPGNVFRFGEPTAGTAEATEITFDWSDHPEVRWVWNGEVYERHNGDTPHGWVDVDGNTGTVSIPTIVAVVGHKYWSRSPDGTGSAVPTTETIGTGTAFVFTGGTVIKGSWARESYVDPIRLLALDGTEITLEPSRLWVAVFPDDGAISWS